MKLDEAIDHVEAEVRRYRMPDPAKRLVLDAARDLKTLAALFVTAAEGQELPEPVQEAVKTAERVLAL